MRAHPVPDVREYAIPGPLMNLADPIAPEVARRAADLVAARGGPKAQWLSHELRDLAGDSQQTMLPLYTGLAQNLGDDAAAEVLRAAGYSGVVNASRHARAFPGVGVRDAKRAAFEPRLSSRDDIYGRADACLLAILAGAGAAGAGTVAAGRSDQSSGTSRRESKPTTGR